MSSKTSGLRAALNIIFFLLKRPYFAWFNRASACLRNTFMLSGDLSFLALDASSRNITSKHQCSWFSIDQCFLTALANSPMSVKDVIKYLVNSRSSSFSYTIDFTAPTDMRFFHSLRCSSHDISVNSLYSRLSILPCPLSIVFICSDSLPNVSKYRTTSSCRAR